MDSYLDFYDEHWFGNEWAKGCVASLGAGEMGAAFGRQVRERCGRLHWAGTETATEWMGYMSGAVQAGQRAAVEVAEAL